MIKYIQETHSTLLGIQIIIYDKVSKKDREFQKRKSDHSDAIADMEMDATR